MKELNSSKEELDAFFKISEFPPDMPFSRNLAKKYAKNNIKIEEFFEKDFLEKYTGSEKLMGLPDDAYFIDIGIPEDYKRAAIELPDRFPNIHAS